MGNENNETTTSGDTVPLMIYRVAIPQYYGEKDCIYDPDRLIPDPVGCPNPGYFVELTVRLLQVLLKTGDFKLKMIRATGFSMKSVNDTTIIGLLNASRADFSPPYMTLSHERMNQVSHVSPWIRDEILLVFKSDEYHEPSLDISELYPLNVLTPILFIGFLMVTVKLFAFFAFRNNENYSSNRHTRSKPEFHPHRQLKVAESGQMMKGKEDAFWKGKFKSRTGLVLWFFFGIFMSLLRSHVTIFFSQTKQPFSSFSQPGDLLRQLELGEFKAITKSMVRMNTLLKPTSRYEDAMSQRFVKAAKRNPPIFLPVSEEEIMENVVNSKSRQKLVYITQISDLTSIKSKYCGFDYFVDSAIPHGHASIMIRPGLAKAIKVTSLDQMVLVKEEQLLAGRYRRHNPNCTGDETRAERRLRQSRNQHRNLSIVQFQGCFWTLLLLHTVNALTLTVEFVYGSLNCPRSRTTKGSSSGANIKSGKIVVESDQQQQQQQQQHGVDNAFSRRRHVNVTTSSFEIHSVVNF